VGGRLRRSDRCNRPNNLRAGSAMVHLRRRDGLPVCVDAQNGARRPINRDRPDPLKIDLLRKILQDAARRFPPYSRMLRYQPVFIKRRRHCGHCERSAASIGVYRRRADAGSTDIYAQGEITHCRSNTSAWVSTARRTCSPHLTSRRTRFSRPCKLPVRSGLITSCSKVAQIVPRVGTAASHRRPIDARWETLRHWFCGSHRVRTRNPEAAVCGRRAIDVRLLLREWPRKGKPKQKRSDHASGAIKSIGRCTPVNARVGDGVEGIVLKVNGFAWSY